MVWQENDEWQINLEIVIFWKLWQKGRDIYSQAYFETINLRPINHLLFSAQDRALNQRKRLRWNFISRRRFGFIVFIAYISDPLGWHTGGYIIPFRLVQQISVRNCDIGLGEPSKNTYLWIKKLWVSFPSIYSQQLIALIIYVYCTNG